MCFQESLDYTLMTQSKIKVCLKIFKILVTGHDASYPVRGWFAALGEGFDLAAVATAGDDNDVAINHLDGWKWAKLDLNPGALDFKT